MIQHRPGDPRTEPRLAAPRRRMIWHERIAFWAIVAVVVFILWR